MANGRRTKDLFPNKEPVEEFLPSTRQQASLADADPSAHAKRGEKSSEADSNSADDQAGAPDTTREKAEPIPTIGSKRPGRLRRPRDVAARLNISDKHVRNLATNGKLVTVRFGKLYLFRDEDIEDFIQRYRSKERSK